MSHVLPTMTNETIGKETRDYYRVFYYAFPGPLSQQKNPTKRFTAQRPEETTCYLQV